MFPPSTTQELTAIVVQGADARTFMQGQLTADVRKVDEEHAAWGALCTGQGRVQTLIALLARRNQLLALVESELAESVVGRLRGFTLSSKVAFEPAPWLVVPLTEAEARAATGDAPAQAGECRTVGELTVLRWWGAPARYLGVGPREELPELGDGERTARARAWRQSDVAAGVPKLFRETQAMFVPQTLNLDLLGGVSFDKGCYVGQEVVARARRGGVPRRLFGFSASVAPPAPGSSVTFQEQEVGHVLDAVSSDSGCELLAVVELEHAVSRLGLGGHPSAELLPRPLPYEVPRARK